MFAIFSASLCLYMCNLEQDWRCKSTDLFSCSSDISGTLGTGRSLFSLGTWNEKRRRRRRLWWSTSFKTVAKASELYLKFLSFHSQMCWISDFCLHHSSCLKKMETILVICLLHASAQCICCISAVRNVVKKQSVCCKFILMDLHWTYWEFRVSVSLGEV